MRYTVVWHQKAQDELASIWLSAIERAAISNAADLIDVVLRENPDFKGVEFQGRRILRIAPLAVAFKVDVDNRIVRVTKVWRDATSN